jgi:galactose mutarotase-like enzyme
MLSIAERGDRYATHILKDSSRGARLEVVPERGGLITQWQVQGQEVLYFDAERFADPNLSVRGGIPILFPICGNLPDNQYTWDGNTFTLKQHGFARDLPWTVVDRGIDKAAFITLELTSDEGTRAVYPFEFRLRFTYRLQGQCLTLAQQFENLGDRPMPFATGLHPYFQVLDKSALTFDLPAETYVDHLTAATGRYGGSFDLTQPELDLALRPLQGSTATVSDRQRGSHLTLTWSEAYQALVFWAVQGKNYYCLEPWTALRNALNTGDRLRTVAPGEQYRTEVTFEAHFEAPAAAQGEI